MIICISKFYSFHYKFANVLSYIIINKDDANDDDDTKCFSLEHENHLWPYLVKPDLKKYNQNIDLKCLKFWISGWKSIKCPFCWANIYGFNKSRSWKFCKVW